MHDAERRCGVVTTDRSGREWICIKPVHAQIYQRRDRRRRGEVIFDNNPAADRHYFVVRYPYRKKGQPT